jgi:hypothetical protein
MEKVFASEDGTPEELWKVLNQQKKELEELSSRSGIESVPPSYFE